MRRLLPASLALVLAAVAAAPAAAQDKTSPNMSLVDTIPYKAKYEDEPDNYGTDIEFATIGGRQYALGGSYYNGLQIVDITNPAKSRKVAVYDCPILQGDVQVFKRGSRTLATYTADAASQHGDKGCFAEAAKKGFDVTQDDGSGREGTFIVDLTNPKAPKTVSFVEVPLGSHNLTVHPSGQWLYNSNSELITSTSPAIEIIDLRDPAKPKQAGELPLTALPGLGTESHDITFNKSGTRAYSAALSHGVVIDTTNPGKPSIVSEFDDETINVWHQSDPVKLRTPEGEKEFLIVEDEFAGAAGGPVCPSGGVHVYDITGELEKAPAKVGYWNIDDFGPTHDPTSTCTAHVFDIHEREQLMTMAFYNGGVRVIDLAGLATGEGLKAIGSYQAADADSWSFKAPKVSRDGVWYGFGNDIARGMDVYRYDGKRPQATNVGTWIPGPALGGTVPGSGEQEQQQEEPSGESSAPIAVPPAPDVVGGITQVAAGAASHANAVATSGSSVTAKAASRKTALPAAGSLQGYRLSCLIKSS
jgi:hypothetical protein